MNSDVIGSTSSRKLTLPAMQDNVDVYQVTE